MAMFAAPMGIPISALNTLGKFELAVLYEYVVFIEPPITPGAAPFACSTKNLP